MQRFTSPPVPGIPPLAMYKADPGIGVPTGQTGPNPVLDFHPVYTHDPSSLFIPSSLSNEI